MLVCQSNKSREKMYLTLSNCLNHKSVWRESLPVVRQPLLFVSALCMWHGLEFLQSIYQIHVLYIAFSVYFLFTETLWHIFFGRSLLIWPRNTISEWITSNNFNNGNLQQHSISQIRTYAENNNLSCWNSSNTTFS